MAAASSSKKARSKTQSKSAKTRPKSTTALSQPLVQDASLARPFALFSKTGDLFAFVSLAVDKHRLRVYDVQSGRSIAEHTVEESRVTAIQWITLEASDPTQSDRPTKKQRKRDQASSSDDENVSASKIQAIILGLSNGSCQIFSSTHGRIVRTLSPRSSTKPIQAISFDDSINSNKLWTSDSEGVIRCWDAAKNEETGSWKLDDAVPYTALAPRPNCEEEEDVKLLAGYHGIHLLSMSNSSFISLSGTDVPTQTASFSGHGYPIREIIWEKATELPLRFVSRASDDRFIYLWDTSNAGKMVSSISLDADVCHMSLDGKGGSQTLAAISNTGKLTVYSIPLSSITKNSQHSGVPTLSPSSRIRLSCHTNSVPPKIVSAVFSPEHSGTLVLACLSGVKIDFISAQYLDDSGEFIPDVDVRWSGGMKGTSAGVNGTAAYTRYKESDNMVVSQGNHVEGHLVDDSKTAPLEGELDIDLAELSLGQRLAALGGTQPLRQADSDSEPDATPPSKTKKGKQTVQDGTGPVPAVSLSRTLIQALHSSDTSLLETCLAHSNISLVHSTVGRLPPQLAVPLLVACVERLGRGKKGATQKGRGSAASSKRGSELIIWIKAVLAVHGGHLLTMPDLIARLSGLHKTLASRLTLQERLLSLSGRLDLVFSQIEMRSSISPADLESGRKSAGKSAQVAREPRVYVEGQSSDEEVDVDMNGDDAASVEDIELGRDSSDEEGNVQEDEGPDFDEASEDEDYMDDTRSGFIDDEAEEEEEEDAESDSNESE